jgi:hypothetical protein
MQLPERACKSARRSKLQEEGRGVYKSVLSSAPILPASTLRSILSVEVV